MKTINRMVLTIMPKKPYIEWANGFDDAGPKLSEDTLHATALLIPEEYDENNYSVFLRKHYKEIFEMELDAWMMDPVLWPKKRSYAMFLDWFTVVPSDTVLEMGKGSIRIEEY